MTTFTPEPSLIRAAMKKNRPLQIAQDRIIDEARKLLSPTPVELHKVPNWLRLRILKAYPGSGNITGHQALCEAVDNAEWLDHWGTAQDSGKGVFVSEPYHFNTAAALQLDEFCRRIDCRWTICANSWWLPASTLRIEITPREEV